MSNTIFRKVGALVLGAFLLWRLTKNDRAVKLIRKMKGQLTKNFNISEFAQKDGKAPVPIDLYDNVLELAENLQILRDYVDKPYRVLSGYRSEDYNRRVGGVKNSFHKKAKAGDGTVDGYTPKQLYDTINMLIEKGAMKQGGLGLYNTFVHYDTRGYKARWDNRK